MLVKHILYALILNNEKLIIRGDKNNENCSYMFK